MSGWATRGCAGVAMAWLGLSLVGAPFALARHGKDRSKSGSHSRSRSDKKKSARVEASAEKKGTVDAGAEAEGR